MAYDPKDPCPLTSREAAEILVQVKQNSIETVKNREEIAKEISEITDKLSKLNDKLDTLRIEDAGRVGYMKGANFWFRVGAWAAIATIGTGILFVIITIISLATGKVDITPLLRQL